MEKNILRKDTMKESQLQKIYIDSLYPRDSKIYSDKGLINLDDGSMGGSHWTAFYVESNKSGCFDSFGSPPDKFLLKQILKPILYHNCEIQDIKSRFSGSYCLYFFFLIERMNYYDAI